MKNMLKRLAAAVILCLVLGQAIFAAESFSDIGGHWSEGSVKLLLNKGAIKAGGAYKPDSPILLDAYLEMIIKATGNSLGAQTPMAFAKAHGMVTDEELTEGGKPLTRLIGVRVAYLTLSSLLGEEDAADVEAATQLSDFNGCHTCRLYLEQSYAKGIVSGRPGNVYDGDTLLTKAEAAVIAARIIDPSLRAPHVSTLPYVLEKRDDGKMLPGELIAILEAGAPPALIVDVRTAEEYKGGHIKGAINIPVDSIIEKNGAQIPKDDTVIALYCAAGSRSQRAYEFLVGLGYENARNLGKVGDWPQPLIAD
jgi:rhodanese-related sulfurtransferase